MNRDRVLFFTALIMLLAFRPEPLVADAPVVCNDGQIPVSVARAYKDMNDAPFTSDWTVQGWYTVSPGTCSAIGPDDSYSPLDMGWSSDDDYSLTLLAFAFTDSTGVWGATRARAPESGGDHYGFKPSNQQLCVQYGAFVYTRDTSKGEPAKACDELAGYYRIPVSLVYYGQRDYYRDPDKVHVSLGPTDRAIPLGSQGPSQASSNAPAAKPPEDSIGTQILKALAKAAAEDGQKQNQAAAAAAAERQRQTQAAEAQEPPHPPAAAPSSPPASSTDDDPIGSGGGITPPTSFKALLCVSADVANNGSWSKPEAGSKMDAFKNLAAHYIVSVAKPGWEYWIVEGRYERFDPATTTSGDQVVSAVSPDSGRFDEFDPKCPSGYAAFWVQVNH